MLAIIYAPFHCFLMRLFDLSMPLMSFRRFQAFFTPCRRCFRITLSLFRYYAISFDIACDAASPFFATPPRFSALMLPLRRHVFRFSFSFA
jgi:hypothetical protein